MAAYIYKYYCFVLIISFTFVSTSSATEKETELDDLLELSLEDLLNTQITSVSGTEETVANAPASLILITSEDIEKRGYNNFFEIFADLPGFDAYTSFGDRPNKAFQRGYRQPYASRTLILINGHVQNLIWSHYLNIEKQIPMSRISRIEVLYGPVSVIYGPNAFLGIINIVTKTGLDRQEDGFNGSVQMSYGSFNSRDIEFGVAYKHKDWVFDIAGKHYESDGPELSDFGEQYELYNAADLANPNIWGPLLAGNNGGPFKSHGEPYGVFNDPEKQTGLFAALHYKDFRMFYNETESGMGYGMEYLSRFVQPHGRWFYKTDQAGFEFKHTFASGLNIKTLYNKRNSYSEGRYTEAAENSYTSLSQWHSPSDSKLFQLDGEYRHNDIWLFTGGLKHERKSLPTGFEICGYFNAFTPFCGSQEALPGELGFGAGVYSPNTQNFVLPENVTKHFPDDFLVETTDKGIFGQVIYDKNTWRISAGIRYDDNSIYGDTTNLRVSVIYRLNDVNTIKLLYGEAFQEPPPNLIFADFSARETSDDTHPETLKNIEAIFIHQRDAWNHEFSAYHTSFSGVIQEGQISAGISSDRNVFGMEYRGRFLYGNFIEGADDITGYVNYTYTDAESDINYSYDKDESGNVIGWQNGKADTGDIAPHKFKAGVDLPLTNNISWNLRFIYHGETELYGRNPLRSLGQQLDAYSIVNTNLSWRVANMILSIKANNLFNEKYSIPGDQSANGGNTATQEVGINVGFYSSLLPQLERNYALSFTFKF